MKELNEAVLRKYFLRCLAFAAHHFLGVSLRTANTLGRYNIYLRTAAGEDITHSLSTLWHHRCSSHSQEKLTLKEKRICATPMVFYRTQGCEET